MLTGAEVRGSAPLRVIDPAEVVLARAVLTALAGITRAAAVAVAIVTAARLVLITARGDLARRDRMNVVLTAYFRSRWLLTWGRRPLGRGHALQRSLSIRDATIHHLPRIPVDLGFVS